MQQSIDDQFKTMIMIEAEPPPHFGLITPDALSLFVYITPAARPWRG